MSVAWVTGGGTGIGRALAGRLLQEGARVVITGRRKDVLEKTQRQLASRPGSGELFSVAGDAFDSAHVNDVVTQTRDRWGDIDLLINNAGANTNHRFPDASFEEYQKSLETNCLTAIRTTQAVLPAMLKSGKGTIVTISSIYGRWASANSASYSVGKFAVAGYTEALRQSLVGTPLHVLSVYPGFIETDMTLPFVQAGSLKSHLGKTPDQLAKKILTAVRRKKAELYYPWYVSWVLRLHRWMPQWSDQLAWRVKR